MSFLDLAKNRYSVRSFKDTKVEDEKLNLILKTGQVAPTAVNYQPQRILVVNTDSGLSKLKQCMRYDFNQTLGLIVCYDKNISWKRKYDNKDMGEIDASIVATHMMLAGHELGIGSTWIGHFDPNAVINTFNIPDHIIPVAILAMGYPSDDAKPHALHNKRFDINETVFFDSFNS